MIVPPSPIHRLGSRGFSLSFFSDLHCVPAAQEKKIKLRVTASQGSARGTGPVGHTCLSGAVAAPAAAARTGASIAALAEPASVNSTAGNRSSGARILAPESEGRGRSRRSIAAPIQCACCGAREPPAVAAPGEASLCHCWHESGVQAARRGAESREGDEVDRAERADEQRGASSGVQRLGFTQTRITPSRT